MDTEHQLSDETLKAIYAGEETDPDVLQALDDGSPGHGPRFFAFAQYWLRRTRNGAPIAAGEVDDILRYYADEDFYPYARNAIGEMARFDLLTADQYPRLRDSLKENDWAHHQLRARCELLDTSTGVLEIVERLIALKTGWAIEEIVERANASELRAIQSRMMDPSVLSKNARHLIREAIGRTLRRR